MAGFLYVDTPFIFKLFSFSDKGSWWKKDIAKPVGLRLSCISGSVLFSPNLIPMLACHFNVQREVL